MGCIAGSIPAHAFARIAEQILWEERMAIVDLDKLRKETYWVQISGYRLQCMRCTETQYLQDAPPSVFVEKLDGFVLSHCSCEAKPEPTDLKVVDSTEEEYIGG